VPSATHTTKVKLAEPVRVEPDAADTGMDAAQPDETSQS
jgi:hypothetical protein